MAKKKKKVFTIKEKDLHYVILYKDEIPFWEEYCEALGQSTSATALKLVVLYSEPYDEEEDE